MNSEDAKSQFDKFREAARQLETDEDEARFNEKLGKLVKEKLAPVPEKPED